MMNAEKRYRLIRTFSFMVFILCLAGCGNQQTALITPRGWYLETGEPASYEIGVEEGVDVEGKKVATIKSIPNEWDSSTCGVMAQYCSVEKYLGKRIRLRGSIKTSVVNGWAGLWMRIDQPDSIRMQYFDNMYERGVTGTSAWKGYEVVLDVPENGKAMGFGAILGGTGQMWFGNISIDVVGTDVPTTAKRIEVMALDAYDAPKNDSIDYKNLNKAELEKGYRQARHNSKDCQTFGAVMLPEETNLAFDN